MVTVTSNQKMNCSLGHKLGPSQSSHSHRTQTVCTSLAGPTAAKGPTDVFFLTNYNTLHCQKTHTHTHTHIHTNKIKEKLNLRVPWTHTAGEEEELYSFLISALNGWEWSASIYGRFNLGGRSPPVIRSLVFPKACLLLKRQNLFPYQKSNHDPSVIQSVA